MPFSSSLAVPLAETAVAGRIVFNGASAAIRPREGAPTLQLAVPVLSGPGREHLLDDAAPASARAGCTIFETPRSIAGFAVAADDADLETAARDLYRRMFAAAGGHRLSRIWNYVPRINAVEGGLENYRRFCRGRSHAFEDHFGRDFQRQLPAASAVGAVAGPLAIAFLGGATAPRHFENPRQVPAFEYPPAYGPRPPSFSRATLVDSASQRRIFVSGTAAIRGHMTVAAGDLAGQVECTCANLLIIAATAGAGADFGGADGWQRSLKIYLRHAADLAAVREQLNRHLLRPDDAVTYLHADLCRADLLVEIEAILTKG